MGGSSDAGNRISSKTPSPHQYVTTTTYNTAGEITKVTDHTGRFTATSYDHAGRPTYTVSGRNTTYAHPGTSTTYNYAGFDTATGTCQVNTTTGACTGTTLTTTTAYNGAGQPTDVTSPAGRPTHYTYDDGGQLATVTQYGDRNNQAGTANVIQLGYDAVGNKTRMVDGENHTTNYAYNTWNLLEKVTEPSTTAHPALSDRQWITSYDADGLVVQEDLPGSVSRTKTYDALERLTGETGSITTTARHLEYDAMGRITVANSLAGNHTYTWTDRGQLKTATGYGGNVTYTYDGEGMLAQRVDAAGTATFTYYGDGSLNTVVDPLTVTTATYTYDDAGRPATINHGTGNSIRTYTYDPYGRTDIDTVTPSAGTPDSTKTDYSYDSDGLVTSKTTSGVTGAGANTYTYDDVGRIASWLNPGGTTTTYQYDKASNRVKVKVGPDERTSTFDARNRITGTTSTAGATLPADSYTWNPRGQLTGAVQNGQTLTYTYDAFERLTQVTGSATPTTSYTYDSLDRVAQRNLSNFGYHDLSNDPVVSPAASGETKLLRDPLGAAIAAKTGVSSATTLLDDPIHGDLTATTSATYGVAAASANYDPWGMRTTSGGSVPLGYQGGYTDPDTGLTNAHARWYNPTLGTFNSRDTWTLPATPVAQANRYLYANGSPLVRRDADGHRPTVDSDGAIAWNPTTAQPIINVKLQVDPGNPALTPPPPARTTPPPPSPPVSICSPYAPAEWCPGTPIYTPPDYPTPIYTPLTPAWDAPLPTVTEVPDNGGARFALCYDETDIAQAEYDTNKEPCDGPPTWIDMAVKAGQEAGVDPRLVLAVIMTEAGFSNYLGLAYKALEWDLVAASRFGIYGPLKSLLGGLLGKGGEGESQAPPSIGWGNIQEEAFNTTKANHQDTLGSIRWTDLIMDPELAVRVTAYRLADLKALAEASATDEMRRSYSPGQVAAGIYNVGESNYREAVSDYGTLGPLASRYSTDVGTNYWQADTLICHSGVYTCS